MSTAANADEPYDDGLGFAFMNDDAIVPSPTALSRLIRSRMVELGLTYAEVAKRGGIAHTTVHAQVTKTKHLQAPRLKTLKGLARALDLPLDLLKAAAVESMGYTHQEIPTSLESAESLRMIAAVHGRLSPADQRKLRAIAQAFLGGEGGNEVTKSNDH